MRNGCRRRFATGESRHSSACLATVAPGVCSDAPTADGYSGLRLQISSDDPQVLSWPWEALRDPELEVLAHSCQIERRLNTVRDPQPLPDALPKDRVNILPMRSVLVLPSPELHASPVSSSSPQPFFLFERAMMSRLSRKWPHWTRIP